MTDPTTPGTGGPPHDPRVGRQRVLLTYLRGALVLAVALAATEVLLAGDARQRVGWALVILLVVVPVSRVVWLTARWFSKGDTRFGLAGVVLLAVLATGLLLR